MPDDDKPILKLDQLHVTFGRQRVLRDISLQIEHGETVAVIGESGCGKTVLLKSMIGLVQPTSGRVLFDGDEMRNLGARRAAQLRTRFGFVFQNAALFDSMTIAQNVAFPLRQHRKKMPESEIRESVRSRLKDVGLSDDVLAKRPVELSGGMRKRVGLARALVLNPDVLLYDEPTTGLDPIMSDVINELMLQTRRRYPVTSVIVTHDMRTARKVADRVVMLFPLARIKPDEPQIVFQGTPAEIERATDPRVVQFVRGEAGERLVEIEQS